MNNKKTKKLKITDLPDYKDYRNAYYAKHPQEIPQLVQGLIEEFNANPHMPTGVLLSCLRDIAEIYGLTKLARATKLNREHLYRSLSRSGNPTVNTLRKLAYQLGYHVTLTRINQPYT